MASKSRSYQLSAVPVTFFAHLIFVAITVLVLVWLLKFEHGLAFNSSNKNKIFNMHPFLMVVGLILFGGEAIMAYKTVQAKRSVQKVVHLVLNLIAILAGVLGIYAVFKFHNETHRPNMYTLHSWLGMSTICLWGFQWIIAFFSFVFPKSKTAARASYRPWHVFIGAVIFLLAVCTAEMGLVERFIFLNLGRNQEALMVNFIGILIFLFATTVGLTFVLHRNY